MTGCGFDREAIQCRKRPLAYCKHDVVFENDRPPGGANRFLEFVQHPDSDFDSEARATGGGFLQLSSVRILVVDDFEPWRRFVSSMLLKKPGLQIVGETLDGLQAVQRAVELKPDLILLDIGLPGLNGIEAARKIRNLVPESKIIFLTQESSAEVVQEALSLGARGYVEAVLSGETFVKSSTGN
jgi:CheY-like chemotaxis protein